MKECKIWSDGSCWPNPGPGGWSAIIEYEGKRKSFVGTEEYSTNNRMEAMPLLVLLPELVRVGVHYINYTTDSMYVIYGITNRDAWKRKKNLKHADIWLNIYRMLEDNQIAIEVKWVKGHSVSSENNACDRLSVKTRLESNK